MNAAGLSRGDRARFLFRSEDGEIDARTWRFHAGWLTLVVVLFFVGWQFLRPYTAHDLRTTPFIAPLTIAAYSYLMVFAAVVLLCAVSYTMLTIKRLRARRLPTGLAGLVPLLALFAGALTAFQPQTPEAISIWYVVAFDVLLVAAALWTTVELGFRAER